MSRYLSWSHRFIARSVKPSKSFELIRFFTPNKPSCCTSRLALKRRAHLPQSISHLSLLVLNFRKSLPYRQTGDAPRGERRVVRCVIRYNRLEAAAPTLGFELNWKSERKRNNLLHQNWTKMRNWLYLHTKEVADNALALPLTH